MLLFAIEEDPGGGSTRLEGCMIEGFLVKESFIDGSKISVFLSVYGSGTV